MYEQIAHLYDQLHSVLSEDVDYLINHRADLQEPILELGCGSGRILIALAQAGKKITGIDKSPAMLTIARAKLHQQPEVILERVTLLEGDISSFSIPRQFGTAICSHNTLYHLPGNERRACLRLIHQHLGPGGTIYIDLDNPIRVADPIDNGLLLLERSVINPVSGINVLQFVSSQVDAAAEKCHLTWIYDESPIAGGSVSRIVVETTFHIVTRHKLELELEEAGFVLREVYGDYMKRPYGEDSPQLLVLAAK